MSLPGSGQISLGDVRSIIQPGGGQIDMNNGNGRYMAHGSFDYNTWISMSDFRNKPSSGGISYTTGNGYAVNTWYSFICPAYQTFAASVNGGGGGGGGGDNHNGPYGNNGDPGGPGAPTYFQFPGFVSHGYGGAAGGGNAGCGNVAAGGGADATGGFGSFTGGGAANGGRCGNPQQGGAWGGTGGSGGTAYSVFTFNSSPYYPGYSSTVSVYIGNGGTAGPQNAGPGGAGYVNVSWS